MKETGWAPMPCAAKELTLESTTIVFIHKLLKGKKHGCCVCLTTSMDERSSTQLLSRWRQTVNVVNAGRRFNHPLPARQIHSDQTGAEERDLEENRPVAPPAANNNRARRWVSIRALIKQIKGKIDELVREAFREPSQDQLQQEHKRCSKYSQKALLFAITTLVAYLGSSSASSSNGSTAFKITMAALFFLAISIDLISATTTMPKCGRALVCLSCLFLVILSYLLLVSFHKDYIFAIVPLFLLFFAVLLQCNKVQPAPQPPLDSDDADQDLENMFDWSAGIVNCGGLISMILGHYMYTSGTNQLQSTSIIGFLFFFTVVLGLYLMMVTTVRSAVLILYIRYLAYLRDILLVGTLIATLIRGVWFSRNYSHA